MKISKETVRKAVLDMNPEKVSEAKFGARVAKKINGIFRSQPRADAPMNRVYMDNTQIDLYVLVPVKNGYRKVRPWLTLMIDDHTGMPVGFALSSRAPKANDVLAALRHSILPKTYTERWVGKSIRMEWEAMGIPDEIVIDNGMDLQANAFYSACLALGISVTTTPPMEPWRKGRMERPFRTLNTMLFHRLPGSTFGSTENTKKYEYNPADFVCVTMDELLEALHITFEEMYCSYHKGIQDIPVRRWREGVRRFPLRMPLDILEFNAQVALRETRTIGRLGLEYKGLFYAGTNLVELRRKLGTDPKVVILIAPEDIREINVLDPRTQTTVRVSCTKRFDKPLSLFMHEEWRKGKADVAKDRTNDSAGADEADTFGTLPADADLRADGLQLIRTSSGARLQSGTSDASQRAAVHAATLDIRRAMEPPRAPPDSKAASALVGLRILNATAVVPAPVDSSADAGNKGTLP